MLEDEMTDEEIAFNLRAALGNVETYAKKLVANGWHVDLYNNYQLHGESPNKKNVHSFYKDNFLSVGITRMEKL